MVGEEVLTMLLLTMMVATMAGACLYAIWPMLAGLSAAGKPSDGPAGEPPAAGRRHRLQSLEGVLVAQLATDEITRHQYQRAMEQAAARDDERHPLAIPPETGSGA